MPLCSSEANFITSNMSRRLLALAPSVARVTFTPRPRMSGMGATPDPSLRLACGQCATCAPAVASSARSSAEAQTQCASKV